jgi:undecaprenyl-diphosphatase
LVTETSAALLLALSFAGLTAAVARGWAPLLRFDERVIAALGRRRSAPLDRAVGPLSMLATQEPLTVQGAIAFTMLAVTAGRRSAMHFAAAAIGSGVLSQLAKRVVGRPRPAVRHLIPWLRGSSYPSGDLLTAAAIYLTIALIVSPYLPDESARTIAFTIVAILLPTLATCRVYAGVHYPSDVVGGMLLGAAWALGAAAWFR